MCFKGTDKRMPTGQKSIRRRKILVLKDTRTGIDWVKEKTGYEKDRAE